MTETIAGPDGRPRCRWCGAAPEFLGYHDTEWGFPVADDRRLFEKLCLESFQSGLSWRTILAKRENFRAAFHGFDVDRVARFTADDVARLLRDEGIVRHRGKIEAVINNARRAQELIAREGSLAAFIASATCTPVASTRRLSNAVAWHHVSTNWNCSTARPTRPQSASTSTVSKALSKELKKQGWTFVGPTTVYAFMQAMGLINDHVEACAIRAEVEQARRSFRRPGR